MGHTAVIGPTESGKTTLVKSLVRESRKNGDGVLVLDPLGDTDWDADRVLRDFDAFYRLARRSLRCVLVIEEAGDYGRKPEFSWFFRQARHWGHKTIYLSQFVTQVLPIVRVNVAEVCLYRCDADSAREWARTFARPEIAQLAVGLNQYEFVHATRWAPPRILKLKL